MPSNYFTQEEDESLKDFKRLYDEGIFDATDFQNSKAVVLEAAKKRRLNPVHLREVSPQPHLQPTLTPAPAAPHVASASTSPVIATVPSSSISPEVIGRNRLFALPSSSTTSTSTSKGTSKSAITSLAHYFTVRGLIKDTSGYSKFWNNLHVTLVRFNRRTTGGRNTEVNRLWKIKQDSTKFASDFSKKGGAEKEWNKAMLGLEKSMTSGTNGGRGAFFESHHKLVEDKLKIVRRDIVRTESFISARQGEIARLSDPAPCSRPWVATLVSTVPGADFDVDPQSFHFVDADKKHAQPSYDLESRALHQEAQRKAEEFVRALQDYEKKFVAALSRSSSGDGAAADPTGALDATSVASGISGSPTARATGGDRTASGSAGTMTSGSSGSSAGTAAMPTDDGTMAGDSEGGVGRWRLLWLLAEEVVTEGKGPSVLAMIDRIEGNPENDKERKIKTKEGTKVSELLLEMGFVHTKALSDGFAVYVAANFRDVEFAFYEAREAIELAKKNEMEPDFRLAACS